MPIQIMSWQDAISDVYLGRVVPVVNYDAEARSPSTVMKIPAVVRIPRATGTIKRGIKFSKLNIAARDKYRCQYCLAKLPLSKITYDHVFPKSRGGETTWDNVVSACSACNARKDNKTPEEAGMLLHTVPRRPHSLPVEPLRLKDMPGIPEQWLEFAVA
jgi:5-methylcytosine-specific restriction endonuclease McrA